MPVHNGLPYLDESIASILDQTLGDFEFIILDDGSTDGTASCLQTWQRNDPRIKVLHSNRIMGPAGSSNYVAEQASANLIARMDADDIAHHDRLRRQWEIFEQHPDVQLVGTVWDGIDFKGATVRPRDRWRLCRSSSFAPFPHGSIMFRRAAFQQAGGYREQCNHWEDLDLFLRMENTGRIVVIPDVLYHHRFHLGSSRFAVETGEVERSIALMYRCLLERRKGGDYDRLLNGPGSDDPKDGRLPVAVFRSIGAPLLWAGHPPKVLRLLIKRGAMTVDLDTAVTLLWAAWGAVSASSLRRSIRLLIKVRDLVASYVSLYGISSSHRRNGP